MKILKVNLFDKVGKLIREIDMSKNGMFIVYGNVKEPKDKKKTINSIGKTLFLRMCNYILGSKVDSELAKSDVAEYFIISDILDNEDKKHVVKRLLNQKTIEVDGVEMTLDTFTQTYRVNRKLISRQVRLYPKGSLLGYNKTETQEDYVDFLKILGLNTLSYKTNSYYELRKEIDGLGKTKSELVKILGISDDKVSQEIFLNEKNLEKTEKLINENSEKIRCLRLTRNSIELQNNYSTANAELKNVQYNITKSYSEKKNLKLFIDNSKDKNPSISSVVKVYNAVNIEIPEMVVRTLDEVHNFYKNVIEDRILNINKKIYELDCTINNLCDKRDLLKKKMEEIGIQLSNNDLYQSAINMIQNLNKEYSDYKYKQGQLAQIKSVCSQIKTKEEEKVLLFSKVSEETKKCEEYIKTLKEFVFKIVKDIYNNDVTAFFDVYSGLYRKNAIPIHVDLTISGETGEGILEVKKNIMDLLMFNFNDESNILILDSSCFNGIDPRQVSGLLNVINTICAKKNKQAIISVNKYQVVNDYVKDKMDYILELSEDDKLLKMSY